MDNLRQIRSACTHTTHSLVHPVSGGYRAHCLKCSMVGPLGESREDALWALSARVNSPGLSGGYPSGYPGSACAYDASIS
jgi:hypothetical protein